MTEKVRRNGKLHEDYHPGEYRAKILQEFPITLNHLEAPEFLQGADTIHFHNTMEIGICHGGKGNILIDGEPCPFSDGTITLIPRHVPHRTDPVEYNGLYWDYLFVDVNTLVLRECGGDLAEAKELIYIVEEHVGCLDSRQEAAFARLLINTVDELKGKAPYHRVLGQSLLMEFLVQLCRRGRDQVVLGHGTKEINEAIFPALNYIARNYMNEIRVSRLAEECLMSESHFRRVFTQAKGMSPNEYLNWYRINMACHLLRTTGDSVITIAERTGFPSIATFNRNFVKVTNRTPADWRKNEVKRQLI